MIHKLILGTAGLGGQPYGREKRRVSEAEATKLICHAYECGIRQFDTAPSYGNAEVWLGRALGAKVVMLFSKTNGLTDLALASMENLGTSRVAFLWHNWRGAELPPWVMGVTCYDSDPIPKVLPAGITYLQKDWNLLRQSTAPKGVRFLARSVFLQGVLTEGGDAPPELEGAMHNARRFAALCGVDLTTLALRAALEHGDIDGVVIGPTTMDELDRCLEIASERRPLSVDHALPLLADRSPATDPRTWTTAAAASR